MTAPTALPDTPEPRWPSIVTSCLSVLMLAFILVTLVGVATGHRPVVITTGSMGDAAPQGSMVIVAPRDGADIAVGDIIVMRRPGATPITHRVVDIGGDDVGTFAITQGDANESPDLQPYHLGDEELVAKWVVPKAGSMVAMLRDPRFVLLTLGGLLVLAAIVVLRSVWRDALDDGRDEPEKFLQSASPRADTRDDHAASSTTSTAGALTRSNQ